VGTLCELFKSHPGLHPRSIIIHESGRIEISAEGSHGVLKEWARALPDHRPHTGLVATFYGSTEADVLEQDAITVTVKRPLFGGV